MARFPTPGPPMLRIQAEALTYDDVSLVPAHSTVLPKDVSLATRLTNSLRLTLPIVSAAMDTVTEARLAVAMAQLGGIGIVHRNLSIERQAAEVAKVKKFEAGVIRERMGTQVLHLSRLIEDLLDVSRIDQGKIALRLERVSLQAVLESAIDTSRPKIDAGLHALTVELPDEPAWIAGDFTRLSQVVSNLLTNAAKYTPAGGELRLSAGLEADFVQIEVEDNGVGVPPEMQERIFALYTQVPGPDTRSSEGLGIGLALVKQLVELHRGSIAVSSEGEDQGSRFTVRLPRSV